MDMTPGIHPRSADAPSAAGAAPGTDAASHGPAGVTVPPYAYDGPAALQARIDKALREVIDPEMVMGVVDVGLVRRVEVAPTATRVVMTMTSAACPVTDLILDEVGWALEQVLPEDHAVQVDLVWQPPWEPAHMSERARRCMGW